MSTLPATMREPARDVPVLGPKLSPLVAILLLQVVLMFL